MEAKRGKGQYNVRTSYIEGNAARQLNAVPDIRREERREPSRAPKKHVRTQPKSLSGIGFASLLILVVAIAATLYVSVEFLKLSAEVNSMERTIVSMESTLMRMKNKNDAAFAAIDQAYDLGEIYQIAVAELGMVYPNQNEIITYQSSDDEYVRRYEKIPEGKERSFLERFIQSEMQN